VDVVDKETNLTLFPYSNCCPNLFWDIKPARTKMNHLVKAQGVGQHTYNYPSSAWSSFVNAAAARIERKYVVIAMQIFSCANLTYPLFCLSRDLHPLVVVLTTLSGHQPQGIVPLLSHRYSHFHPRDCACSGNDYEHIYFFIHFA